MSFNVVFFLTVNVTSLLILSGRYPRIRYYRDTLTSESRFLKPYRECWDDPKKLAHVFPKD